MEKSEVIQKIKDEIKKHRERCSYLIKMVDQATLPGAPPCSQTDISLTYTVASKHEGQADAYTECLALIEGMGVD